MKELNDLAIEWAKAHKSELEAEYPKVYQAVGQSDAVYKGAPVPFLYVPKMFSPEDIQRFEAILENMFDVVNRTIELYQTEQVVRDFYQFDPRLEALILADHGYDMNVPMGRFDIFYRNDGSFQFCELNTDGSSAMNEEQELSQILTKTAFVEELGKTHKWKSFELFHSWVKTVEEIYGQFSGGKTKPHVAIVDFIDKGSPLEFQVFQKAFVDNGMDCTIIDPRELTFKDGLLYANDQPVDVIYRRLVTRDLMDRYDEIPALIQGIQAGKTCVVGPIKSQVVHTKKFFEALHNETIRAFFTLDQLNFIDAHVPFTAPLTEVRERFLDHKDDFIIKPIDYYASKGVCAGEDYTPEEWAKVLESNVGDTYLIQTYCKPALTDNLFFDNEGKMSVQAYRNITGMFVYGEKLCGIYSRAGLNAIISGIHDGYTLSTILVEKA